MILVTGGAGYVGSHCVKELLRRGHAVVVFDNLSQGHRKAVLTEHFVKADLLDQEALSQTFDNYSIDAVMHFAGLIRVGESVDNPQIYYQNNVLGTLNLLQTMREHGVNRMIFSSSAAVYGDPEVIPIPESHSKQPKNPYGRTKWMVEEILRDYMDAYGLHYIALRYFNAAGCDLEGQLGENHDPETHLIPIVLDVALGKRNYITIFGNDYDTPDGTCIRDYVHVSDLAKAHVLSLNALTNGAESTSYNLGIGSGYSVREVIDVCRRVTRHAIIVREGERRAGDPPRLIADPARIKRDLNWQPRFTDLTEIVTTAWRQRRGT
jgi:UDP-glucose 4-epimerase